LRVISISYVVGLRFYWYCWLLGIGLPSYVEKRPKTWEVHVSLNPVERGHKFYSRFSQSCHRKFGTADSFTVGSRWNFYSRFGTHCSSFWPVGSLIRGLSWEILISHCSSDFIDFPLVLLYLKVLLFGWVLALILGAFICAFGDLLLLLFDCCSS